MENVAGVANRSPNVMGDHQDGDALLSVQRFDQMVHLRSHLWVKSGNRLVQKQHFPGSTEGARQKDALLLTAGKLPVAAFCQRFGSIGDDFLAMLDEMDLVGLSWFDAGVRSFYTREKVTDLEQLQGLTLRVQESDMMSEMITDLGAEPVQVVYSQVYAALRNGQIDGAENNWPSYDAMGHYEVAPYFLQDEHTRVPEVQLASTAAIEKLEALDPSYPEVLRTCARESARTERRLWAEREARSEKELREWGVEVTTLPDAEKQKFRAAVQPLYDRFADQAELLERIKES